MKNKIMNKIHKALKAFGLILRHPYLLNHVLNDEDVMHREVAKQYPFPDGLPVVPLTDWLPGGQQTVSPYTYLSGGTWPTDLALLKTLAEHFQAENYFEIGTWRGESVANVASIVPHCTTLNLSREEILQLTHSEDYADLHFFFSKNLPNVTQLLGNSETFDFSPYEKQFDLIFIDGDHHYEAVRRDTQSILPLLKNEKSIIVWHDYAYDPEKIRWSVFKGILDGLPQELHPRLAHISNTLCAVLLPEPAIGCQPLVPYAKPNHYFDITIQAKKL